MYYIDVNENFILCIKKMLESFAALYNLKEFSYHIHI